MGEEKSSHRAPFTDVMKAHALGQGHPARKSTKKNAHYGVYRHCLQQKVNLCRGGGREGLGEVGDAGLWLRSSKGE